MKTWLKVVLSIFLILLLLGVSFYLRSNEKYISKKEVLLINETSYYQMRQIHYTIQNFPQTLQHDTHINYPEGSKSPFSPGSIILYASICKVLGANTLHELEVICAKVPLFIGIAVIILSFIFAWVMFENYFIAFIFSSFIAISPQNIFITQTGNINQAIWLPFFILLSFLFYCKLLKSDTLWKSCLWGICSGVCFAFMIFCNATSFFLLLIPFLIFVIKRFLAMREGEWQKDYEIGTMVCFCFVYFIVLYFSNITGINKTASPTKFSSIQLTLPLYICLVTCFVSILSFVAWKKEFSIGKTLLVVLFIIFIITGSFILLKPQIFSFVWKAVTSTPSPALWSLSVKEIFYLHTWLFPTALIGFFLLIFDMKKEKNSYRYYVYASFSFP